MNANVVEKLREVDEVLQVWTAQVHLLLARARRCKSASTRRRLAPMCADLEHDLERVQLTCRALEAAPRDRVAVWVAELEEQWRHLRRTTSRLSIALRDESREGTGDETGTRKA